MGKAARNETAKLEATYFNNIAVSFFVVGMVLPTITLMQSIETLWTTRTATIAIGCGGGALRLHTSLGAGDAQRIRGLAVALGTGNPISPVSSEPKRRFPPPWTVNKLDEDCFTVQDANGVSVAFIYSRDDLHRQRSGDYNKKHLTSDEARRVAATIAKIPELFGKRT
jgi:hypothetical protein